MGQQEVVDYLIKKHGPAEISEMQKCLHITRSNISRSCRVLKKENAILINQVKERCFVKYMITINPKYLRKRN